jgi:hypothetical protein
MGSRFFTRWGWAGLFAAAFSNLLLQVGILAMPDHVSLQSRAIQAQLDQAALQDMSFRVAEADVVRVDATDERRIGTLGGLRGVALGLGKPVSSIVLESTGRNDAGDPITTTGPVLQIDVFGPRWPDKLSEGIGPGF